MMVTDGGNHKLVITQRGTGLREVSDLNLKALPLHFTLAFPWGSPGWHPGLRQSGSATEAIFQIILI